MLLTRQVGPAEIGRTHVRQRLAQRHAQRSARISCRLGAAAAIIARRHVLHCHLHRRAAHSGVTCLPRQKRNQRESKKAKKAAKHGHQVTCVFGQFNPIVTDNKSGLTSCPTASPFKYEACGTQITNWDENTGCTASPALLDCNDDAHRPRPSAPAKATRA